jgi:hypothetical protein
MELFMTRVTVTRYPMSPHTNHKAGSERTLLICWQDKTAGNCQKYSQEEEMQEEEGEDDYEKKVKP